VEDTVGAVSRHYVPGELCICKLGHITVVIDNGGASLLGREPDTVGLLTLSPHLDRAAPFFESSSSWTLTANTRHSVQP
jgi:hypothetical protein